MTINKIIGLALGCFLFSVFSFSYAEEDSIAVIVNPSNKLTNLSGTELMKIYKGASEKWPDGQRIVVINRPFDSMIRKRFYRIVLGAEPTQKFFVVGSPVVFKTMVLESDLATRKFVARIPNAIGYVTLSEVDASVKALTIDGKSVEDPNYKLK